MNSLTLQAMVILICIPVNASAETYIFPDLPQERGTIELIERNADGHKYCTLRVTIPISEINFNGDNLGGFDTGLKEGSLISTHSILTERGDTSDKFNYKFTYGVGVSLYLSSEVFPQVSDTLIGVDSGDDIPITSLSGKIGLRDEIDFYSATQSDGIYIQGNYRADETIFRNGGMYDRISYIFSPANITGTYGESENTFSIEYSRLGVMRDVNDRQTEMSKAISSWIFSNVTMCS